MPVPHTPDTPNGTHNPPRCGGGATPPQPVYRAKHARSQGSSQRAGALFGHASYAENPGPEPGATASGPRVVLEGVRRLTGGAGRGRFAAKRKLFGLPRAAAVTAAMVGVLAMGGGAAFAAKAMLGAGDPAPAADVNYGDSADIATVKVPTSIPMMVGLDNKIYKPSADKMFIENQGADEVELSGIDFTPFDGSVNAATDPTVLLNLKTSDAPSNPVTDASASKDLYTFAIYNENEGSSNAGSIKMQAGNMSAIGTIAANSKKYFTVMANVDQSLKDEVLNNLTKAKKLGTFTFRFDTTKPKVMFAVFSATDGSLRLYNRSDVPNQGDNWNGRAVTNLYKQGDTNTFTNKSIDLCNIFVERGPDGTVDPESAKQLPWYDKVNTMMGTSIRLFKIEDDLPIKSFKNWFAVSGMDLDLAEVDFGPFTGSELITAERMFSDCLSLSKIERGDMNFPKLENADGMFKGTQVRALSLAGITAPVLKSAAGFASSCTNLTAFDFEGFVAPNLRDTSKFFYNDKKLTIVKLDKTELPKLANVSSMFGGCVSYNGTNGGTSVDFGRLVDSPLEDISYMFASENKLDSTGATGGVESLDISSLNLSKVKNAEGLFYKRSLKKVTLPRLSSGLLENVSYMFQNCEELTSVNMSDWTLTGLSTADSMFEGVKKLTDLPNLKVNGPSFSANKMFYNMNALTSISFATPITGLTSAQYMFAYCWNLPSLTLSQFKNDRLTDASSFLSGCSSLATVTFTDSSWKGLKNASHMFDGCKSLTNLTLDSFWNAPITDMSYMFKNAIKLTSLDLDKLTSARPTNVSFMFNGGSSLTSVKLTSMDLSAATNAESMFQGCSGLTELNLYTNASNKGAFNPTNMKNMFNGCAKLEVMDLGNLSTQNVKAANNSDTVSGMFDGMPVLQKFSLHNSFDFAYKKQGVGLLPSPKKVVGGSDQRQQWYRDGYYFCDNDYGDHKIEEIPDGADRKTSANGVHVLTPYPFVSRFIWSAPNRTVYVARLHVNQTIQTGVSLSQYVSNAPSDAVLTSLVSSGSTVLDPENITYDQAMALDYKAGSTTTGSVPAENFIVLTYVYPRNTIRWLAGGTWKNVDMKKLDGTYVEDARYMCAGVTVDKLDLSTFKTGSNLKDMRHFMEGAKVREVDLTGMDLSGMNMGKPFYENGDAVNAQYKAFSKTSDTLRRIVIPATWKWYDPLGVADMSYYIPSPSGYSGWDVEGFSGNGSTGLGGIELAKKWTDVTKELAQKGVTSIVLIPHS